jgi:hypothetical protein
MDLSADGQWALTQSASDDTQLSLVSVNAAQPKPISGHGLAYQWAKFLPDAKEILVAGRYPKQSPGIYRQRLPDGRPILLKPGLNFENAIIDEKGHTAVGCDGSQIVVLDLSNGNARFVKTPQCVSPMAFVDAQTVLTRYQDGGSIQLDLLNLTSGKVTPYRRYAPPDLAGSSYILPLHVAKDLQTFVYSRMQSLSNLFVVSGWK